MGSPLIERNIVTASNGEGFVTGEELGQDLLTEQILHHLLFEGNDQDPLGETVEEAVKKQDLVLAVDVNEEGETASDTNSQEIRRLLLEAGDFDFSSNDKKSKSKSLAHSSMETKGVLLVVLVLFAGASLTVVSSPPSLIMESRERVFDGAFSFIDVITGCMPAAFYFLVGSTAVFATSMGAIAVVLCFLPCTVVSQFAGLTVLMLYVLLVDKAMPRYTVKVGSRSISGSVFVWLSALALICSGLTVVALLKNVASCVFNIATALTENKYSFRTRRSLD